MIADSLLDSAKSASVKFRRVPLAPYNGINAAECTYNAKWKVYANEEIEVDV